MCEGYPNTSPYAYCAHDPIGYIDPSGLLPIGWDNITEKYGFSETDLYQLTAYLHAVRSVNTGYFVMSHVQLSAFKVLMSMDVMDQYYIINYALEQTNPRGGRDDGDKPKDGLNRSPYDHQEYLDYREIARHETFPESVKWRLVAEEYRLTNKWLEGRSLEQRIETPMVIFGQTVTDMLPTATVMHVVKLVETGGKENLWGPVNYVDYLNTTGSVSLSVLEILGRRFPVLSIGNTVLGVGNSIYKENKKK